MKKIVNDRRVRYLFVGGSGALIEYVGFYVMNSFSPIVISNAISFCIGLFYTFFLHRILTFKGDYAIRGRGQLILYLLLAVTNLLISSLLIVILVNWLLVNPLIAKLLNMVLIVLWNFLIMNRLIFKHR